MNDINNRKTFRFIGLKVNRIYFDKYKVLKPLIDKLHLDNFNITYKRGDSSITTDFYPKLSSIHNIKKDLCYTMKIDAFLSGFTKGPSNYVAFTELIFMVKINRSKDWTVKDFYKYLNNASHIMSMSYPALKKVNHIFYNLFSFDNMIGEIHVPDLTQSFYTKLLKKYNNK